MKTVLAFFLLLLSTTVFGIELDNDLTWFQSRNSVYDMDGEPSVDTENLLRYTWKDADGVEQSKMYIFYKDKLVGVLSFCEANLWSQLFTALVTKYGAASNTVSTEDNNATWYSNGSALHLIGNSTSTILSEEKQNFETYCTGVLDDFIKGQQ